MEPNRIAKRMLEKAQALCSRKEKCLFDIRTKLSQWGAPPEMIPSIEKELLSDKFIDESRFALNFARDKARFNKWGPKKIEMSLRAKRISDEDIKVALTEVEPFTNCDTLADLIFKKAKTIKYSDKYELKSKLVRFGLSRGFDYNEILKAISSLSLEGNTE